MFNEIDGDFDDVAIRTFKADLPTKHDLRKSLTKKSVKSVSRLINRIDEYKLVEENQQQGKGKAKVIPQEKRDFRKTNTIITNPKGILLGNLGLRLLKWLTQCSESQYIKSWRRSRMNYTSNDQTRWEETL